VMADAKKKVAHAPRNTPLSSGVMKFSKARMYRIKAVYKKKKFAPAKKSASKPALTKEKEIGGQANGGKRIVRLKREPRALDSEREKRISKPKNKKPFSQHKRRLRSSLTPGTVVIMLAGRHKGKRAVFIKQLASGLLLVSGPMTLNNCPLRRINQIYVIATKTKVDLSGLKLSDHLNDAYFKRAKRDRRRKTKGDESDIFATKKDEYVVSDQRKKDQIEVDKQVLEAIRKHKDKKFLFGYLGSMFSLRKNEFPHRLIF